MLSLRYSGDSDKDGSGKKTSSSGPSSSLPIVSPVGHELILGGQRSGKSRRAEQLAEQWLKGAAGRKAAFVATAQARDDEMRHRIERHQEQRRARLPGMRTIEEPLALDRVIRRYSRPERLLVIDCLTLWLANQLARHEDVVPRKGQGVAENFCQSEAMTSLLTAIEQSRGPLVFVSNEIGLGVVPVGAGVRAYVDALGWLNQQVAACCQRACLMVAGQPLWLKRETQPAATQTSVPTERPYEAIPTLVETLLGTSSASHPVLPSVAAALSGLSDSMVGTGGHPPATFENDSAAQRGRRSDEEGTDGTGPGTVWFVGAGPGDPDLLTVKGRDLIAQAGAILFAGSLVSEAATRWAPPGCEIADSKGMTLEEICHWLASRALRHRTVIRLQTGDPSLYGALIEMVQPLDDAGVPVKVVPGVSSAFAAAAAGGHADRHPHARGGSHADARGRGSGLAGPASQHAVHLPVHHAAVQHPARPARRGLARGRAHPGGAQGQLARRGEDRAHHAGRREGGLPAGQDRQPGHDHRQSHHRRPSVEHPDQVTAVRCQLHPSLPSRQRGTSCGHGGGQAESALRDPGAGRPDKNNSLRRGFG